MENRFGWSDRREVNDKNEIDPSQYGVIILPPRDRYAQENQCRTIKKRGVMLLTSLPQGKEKK